MNVLAFDTCFGQCSAAVGVALGTPAERIAARCEEMATGHAERLVPMIGEVLAEAGIAVAELDRIAVTIGPGSFTGTRIGIAAARALSRSTGVPVVGMTSLEAIARDPILVSSLAHDRLLIALDAHRGEVYAQKFDAETRLALSPPALVRMDDVLEFCNSVSFAVAGSAAREVAALVAAAGLSVTVVVEKLLPNAASMLALAAARAPGALPSPLYLRPPDAKPPAAAPLARVTGQAAAASKDPA